MQLSVRSLRSGPHGCLHRLRVDAAFTHANHTVDLPAFLDEEALGGDVAVDHARGLDLDALVGADAASHLAADDRLAGDHVAFHFPALPDEHLTASAHSADHGAFNLHDPVGVDISD